MSEDNKVELTEEKIEVPEEVKKLKALKAKANLMGIKYNPNIGIEKLKAKVDLAMSAVEDKEVINTHSEGPDATIRKAEEAARKLRRVKIKELDSTQLSDPTIVINVGNRHFKVGAIVRKNVEQDVPQAVVNAIKEKTMVEFVDEYHPITKRPTGNRSAVNVPRFNIIELD